MTEEKQPNYVKTKLSVNVPKEVIMMKLARQRDEIYSKTFAKQRAESVIANINTK